MSESENENLRCSSAASVDVWSNILFADKNLRKKNRCVRDESAKKYSLSERGRMCEEYEYKREIVPVTGSLQLRSEAVADGKFRTGLLQLQCCEILSQVS